MPIELLHAALGLSFVFIWAVIGHVIAHDARGE